MADLKMHPTYFTSAVDTAAHAARPTPVDERQVQQAIKRGFDVVAASAGIVLLAPFLLLVAILVRIESRGPALFRQRRVGRRGVPFTFYKFRTMVDGNDPAIHQEYVKRLITEASDDLKGEDGCFKLECDPRVTRIGAFLRRSSIDELPQLFNVLLGDMSLVGPRPPLPYEVELYTPHAMRRLECPPGITGLWQVSGRCATTFDDMVDLDIRYQETWSLMSDAKILARTLPAVLRRKGAR